MIFEFGEFTPDLSQALPGKTTKVVNVIPTSDGYLPFPSFVSQNVQALPSRCLGGASIRDLSGISRSFLATATKIYEVTGLSLTDKTRVSGNYSVAGTNIWSFVIGKNQLIATTIEEPVQVITLGEANFTNLFTSTRKPKGNCVTVSYLDWLVLGDVTDSVDGDRPTRVWWSERGDFTNMDPNIDDRSGFRDLDQQYGKIVALHTREFTSVFQEQAIHRMTFEGGSSTFRFDLVERHIGLISPGAIAHFGPNSYYLSTNGFQVFNGNVSTPIGHDKVDRYVLSNIDYNNPSLISCSIYPKYKLVAWGIPFAGSTGINKIFLYNWASGKWSEVDVNLERILPTYTLGVGVDDANFTDLYIDSLPQSEWLIDDVAFAGGLPVFSAIDQAHNYLVASGSPMKATLETNYVNMTNRVIIDRLIPVIAKVVNPQLMVYIRNDFGDMNEVAFGPFNRNLFMEFVPIVEGRHFRFGITMDNFERAIGLDVSFFDKGER